MSYRAVSGHVAAIDKSIHGWVAAEGNAFACLELQRQLHDLGLAPSDIAQLQVFVSYRAVQPEVARALAALVEGKDTPLILIPLPPCSGADVAIVAWAVQGAVTDGWQQYCPSPPGATPSLCLRNDLNWISPIPPEVWLSCFERFEARLRPLGLSYGKVASLDLLQRAWRKRGGRVRGFRTGSRTVLCLPIVRSTGIAWPENGTRPTRVCVRRMCLDRLPG